MSSKKVLMVFFPLLSAAFLTYYYYAYKLHPRPKLDTLGQPGHITGAFSFTTQDGTTITDKDVKGKIKVVEYFFTTCRSICPIMNENMVNVYNEFRNTDDVVILSHTVDPEIDTAAQLKRYAQKFLADGKHWIFLTGTKEALYKKAIYDYLVPVAENDTVKVTPDFIHTERFVLVDKNEKIRGKFYDGTNKKDVDELIKDIKELQKEK
jgi:protein SCO1